jgi:hypothetical protein
MTYTLDDLAAALVIAALTVVACLISLERERRRERQDRATARAEGRGPYEPTAGMPTVDLTEALLEHAHLMYPDVGRPLALCLLQLRQWLPRIHVGVDVARPGVMVLRHGDGRCEYVPMTELA